MKKLQTIILLAVLGLTATPLKAQYFEWVRTYQSTVGSGTGSPDNDNMVLDMAADSQGNVYFIGTCVRGAAINGEELLSVPHNKKNLVIAKMSTDGEMVWHRAFSCWNLSMSGGYMQLVGDSVLMCLVGIEPPRPNLPDYWIDTLIQYPDWFVPIDSAWMTTAFITFDLEGNLKEQHFLNVGFLDTMEVPLADTVDALPYPRALTVSSMHIDSDGNIILGVSNNHERCYLTVSCDTCDIPWQSVEYSVENGGIGTVRILVDGTRIFSYCPENRPIIKGAKLLKFSPHFDSLLEVRYLMQSRLDSPRTGLGVQGEITDSKILHITSDPEGNIYVVGLICVLGSTDSIVPIDSTQGLSLHLNGPNNGFLIKYDPNLRPVFVKQLELEENISTKFYDVLVEGDDLFVLGSADGYNNIPHVFYYDGEPLYNIDKCVSFFRISKEDGRLLSHGSARSFHENGTWQCNVPIHDQTRLTVHNNRVATRTKYWGNIAFAGDTSRAYRGQVAVIWDYDGHELALIDLHAPNEDNRGIGALFTDSSLYLCGMFLGEATFGDTSFNVPRSNGYLARYVDTAFLRPYVHHEPVAVTQPVAPAEPFFTLTPNPATGKVTVTLGILNSQLSILNSPMTLTVCDATGREVLKQKASTSTTILDLSKLPAGTYFVTVTIGGQSGTRKLVVK